MNSVIERGGNGGACPVGEVKNRKVSSGPQNSDMKSFNLHSRKEIKKRSNGFDFSNSKCLLERKEYR
jgi:hypothetical protein